MGNGFKTICEGLKPSCNALKTITMWNCFLNDEQSECLGETFKHCSKLENVDLSDNEIMRNGFKTICEGLKLSSSTLKQINLSSCFLTDEQAKYLGETFRHCSLLENVEFDNQEIGGNEFKMICKGLKSSFNALTQISMCSCYLTDEKAKYLGETFQHCYKLENVDLSCNQDMGNGFKMICKGLKSSSNTLKRINTCYCKLDENQAKYLGEMFQLCSSLVNVDLSENENMGIGFKMICEGLKSSSRSLKQINMGYCGLNDELAKYLGQAFQHYSKLENVNLSSNNEMENGFETICEGLKFCSNTLKYIDMSHCSLNDEQAKYLGTTFHHCSILENVDLSYNSTMGNGFKTICDGLKSCSDTLTNITALRSSLNDEDALYLGEKF